MKRNKKEEIKHLQSHFEDKQKGDVIEALAEVKVHNRKLCNEKENLEKEIKDLNHHKIQKERKITEQEKLIKELKEKIRSYKIDNAQLRAFERMMSFIESLTETDRELLNQIKDNNRL